VIGLLAPGKVLQYSVEAIFAVGVIVAGKLWMKFMLKKEAAEHAHQGAEASLNPKGNE
jgi:hypothetical protein